MFLSRGLRFKMHCWDFTTELICESEESFCVRLKMKRQRSERIGVPLFHDSRVVQVCVFAEMSRQVQHHHQSCCFEREPTLWPLCSECESSISLCTQHARKPSPFFFFFFPVWLREKAAFFPSIFGHMEHRQWAVAFWCRTNIPILCGICTFWNAFSLNSAWLWV